MINYVATTTSTNWGQLFASIGPLLGIFAVAGIGWAIKMLIDRNRNMKRSTDHAWIEIWPKVGKVYSYLTPILEGGTVRIQDRQDKEFARYTLGQGGAKRADWPPGKSRFVQVSVDKLIYNEGDSIPMSVAVLDRPVLDAHQLDALIENVAVAAAEATRISLEESGGTSRKTHPLMWVYLGLLIIGALCIVTLVVHFGLAKDFGTFATKVGAALGIK